MKPGHWTKLMLIGLLAVTVVVAGCTKSEEAPDPGNGEEPGVVEETPEEPVIEETAEEKLAQEWATLKEEATEAAELIAFVDDRLSEATQEQADGMIRDVFAFYEQDLSYSQEQFFSQDMQPVLTDVQLPVTEDNVAEVPDETVRKLISSKLKGNYKFIVTEGSFFPIVDYGAFQAYEEAISYDLLAYINLKAMESDEVSASDGGLIIGWDELARRLLTAEDYLKLYASSPEADEVRDIYLNDYLPKYMYGLNNTPNFDFETMQVTADAKASYEATAAEHPDSVTGQLVQGFLDVLEETDGQLFEGTIEDENEVPEVKAYRDSLEKEFDRLMGQQAEIS